MFAMVGCIGSLVCAGHDPSVADTACEPFLLVDGDPVLVSSLTRQLTQRGIAVDGPASEQCPAVRATVVRDGQSVSVTLVDQRGARHRRRVTTTDIAATWIESRIASDVSTPLLSGRTPPPEPAPTLAPPGSVDEAVTRPTPPSRRGPVSATAAIETGAGSDSSSWRSYAVSACAPLGPMCVGVLGRFGTNPDHTHNDGLTFADRTSTDVYVTASLPLTLGRATVQPEIGAGVGWLRTRQVDEPFPPFATPEECAFMGIDPALCVEPDKFDITSRGVRAAIGLRASVPLADRVALDLGISAELHVGAHTDVYLRDYPYADDGCIDDPVSPGCGPDGMPLPPPSPEEDPFLQYAGEPGSVLRAGIGLRVGLP